MMTSRDRRSLSGSWLKSVGPYEARLFFHARRSGRRSAAVMPPHTPYGTLCSIASARQASITTHSPQIALAAVSSRSLVGPSKKNASEGRSRHAEAALHPSSASQMASSVDAVPEPVILASAIASPSAAGNPPGGGALRPYPLISAGKPDPGNPAQSVNVVRVPTTEEVQGWKL